MKRLIFVICWLLSVVLVVNDALAQAQRNNIYAVSPLSIGQAREQLRQVERRIAEQTNSLPALPPKDMFETTAAYERRKAEYEKQLAPLVSPLRAQVRQLQSSVYVFPVKPVFKNYDADTQQLTTTLSDKTIDAFVENNQAKQMYQDWASVQIAVSYFEEGSQPSLAVLLWKGFQFGGVPKGEGTSTNTNVYAVGNGVTEAVPISMPQPEYSDDGRKARVQGSVELLIVVNADGTVTFNSVRKGLGYGLDQKAIEAVKKWKFLPGKKDGKPVATYSSVLMNFSLR